MIIAFMGNDGSGKTTLTILFTTKLKKLGFNVERRICTKYLILGFLQEKLIRKNNLDKMREHLLRNSYHKNILRIWPLLVFLDCLLTFLYLSLLKRHKIVVFDRYFYDFLLGFEDEGISNKIVEKFFLLLPKPDMGFILDVSPEIAYQRKKNIDPMDLDYYEDRRKRYLSLASKLDVYLINTEKSIEECINEIFKAVRINFESLFSG